MKKTKLEVGATSDELESRLSWEEARAEQAERERDEAKRDLKKARQAFARDLNKLISNLETCERKCDWLTAQLLNRLENTP